MSLPFSYVTRSLRGLVFLSAVFVASHQFSLFLVKDYTTFKDKSALYGRDLQEGEEPSW